jgi:4-amino-4-deoxy-L-arabinose transferase-like glycosyltransferase
MKFKNVKISTLILLFFSFFAPLGAVALFNLDEGAFGEATREMVASGNYLTTYLNGELRFDKPILIYWFQSLSVQIFGLSEFALRLPSAIFASFWGLAIFYFTRKHFDEQKALLAIIFFISSLQISIIAKAAIADGLLNFFIALSMFFIYEFINSRDKKWLYLTFGAIALGVLTKGPVAVMVPFVVSALFLFYKKEPMFWLKSIFNPIGILIFFVIAAPWYVLEYLDQGQKFIDGFFFKHNVSRFSSSMEGHSGSIFYFIPVLILGLAPFTGYFLNIFTKIREIFKSDLEIFLFIWFAFVFLFFSFSGTKLPHYVIYGYTPLFILASLYAHQLKNRFLIILPSVFFLTILLILPTALDFFVANIKDEYTISLLSTIFEHFNMWYQLKILFAIGLILFFWYLNLLANFQKILFVALIFISTINFVFMPALSQIEQQPIKEAGLKAKSQALRVTMHKLNYPTFNVYFENTVKKENPQVGELIVTKTIHLKDFNSYEIIFQKSGISLIKLKG